MIRVGMLETIHRWDVSTFQRIISAHLNSTFVASARLASKTADGWAYPLVPAMIYLLAYPLAVTFFITTATAFVIERLIYVGAKHGFKRRRPANVVAGYQSLIIASDEFSFPSGHTSAAFLMVTLLVLFYGPMFAPLYLWAGFVGLSRIILGVHFPTDILVGATLGSGIAFTVSHWLTLQ